MKTIEGWRHAGAATVAALAVLLAACGGGGGGSDDHEAQPSGGNPQAALECERLAYACRWDQVEPALIGASDEIAGALAARLAGGERTEDAVAWLKTRHPEAVVEHDDDKIRLRLPGGRPVWALGSTLGAPGGAAPQAVRRAAPRASAAGREGAREQPFGIAGGDTGPVARSALLLNPYRWQGSGQHFAGAGDVATLLAETPGYAGRVSLRENASAEDRTVDVGSFTEFGEHDVVFVGSHTVTLCTAIATCRLGIAAQPVDAAQVLDLVHAQHPGVEVLHDAGGAIALLLTADFFRHTYPEGLDGKLLWFSGPRTADSDIALALQGRDSVYFGFDGPVSQAFADGIAEAVFEWMALGLSAQQAYAREAEGVAEGNGAELLHNGRDMHIRDLVIPADGMTGALLENDGPVEVIGTPGDGRADKLLVSLTVDGMSDDLLPQQTVIATHGGREAARKPVSEGQRIDELRWRVDLEVPLGADVRTGQALDLAFGVNLASGGVGMVRVAPVVADPTALPAAWEMEIVYESRGVGSTTRKIAQVIWLADPANDPSSSSRRYRVQSGRMQIEFQSDLNSCRTSHSTPLAITETNGSSDLLFDIGDSPVTYEGLARLDATPIQVTGTCSDGSTLTFDTDAGGVYFINFGDAMNSTTGFSGSFDDGATLPTIVRWTAKALNETTAARRVGAADRRR